MPWTTISTNSQITAIHAALLPTEPDGVVLYFGDWAAAGGVGVQNLTYSRLYRMTPGLAAPIENFPDDAVPDTDAFCCGQAFLSDGRLLAAGGTFGWANAHEGIHEPHYDGERACWIYLPYAKRWVRAADMNFQPGSSSIGGGRWYPTLVTLGNGEVFTAAGHPTADDLYPPGGPYRHNNNTPERYSPSSGKWTLLTADITAPPGINSDSYPRFRLLPDGRLFSDTAGAGGSKRIFDPFAGVWTGADIGNLNTLPGFYGRGSEASSVLLPLLPPHYRPRVLAVNSGTARAYRIDVDASPAWELTPAREGAAAGRSRDNACATLLPTGQVLVTGGWPGNAGADDPDLATRLPELYTPGINWAAGDFSNTAAEQWATLDEPAPTRRGYHSVALLLPDGRVWHGGSTTTGDGANRNIELFTPAYATVGGRPTITSCPANIGYAMSFPVGTPQANSISRVALIRCGSITHGFNSDQRYVGVSFNPINANTIQVNAPPRGDIAPPGFYMLFLIDNQERVCQRAAFIRVSKQKLLISADISTYSIHEVNALGLPAQFESALFVVFDGFLPHEVTAPGYTLRRPDNSAVPGMSVTFGPPAFEAGSQHPDVAQRVVYPVRVRFTSTAAFDAIPAAEDFQTIVFRAEAGLFAAQINLQLSRNPNPRMRDGDPPWLSVDLRVFKTNPGQTPTGGVAHPPANQGAAGAYGYIQNVLSAYNSAAGEANHPFDALPIDQEINRLELGTHDAQGNPAFNYAVARVRFRAPVGIDAVDVRVFFRMWTTGWSGLEFYPNGSYRRHGDGPAATPLLGLRGGEINTIPCFAQARSANMQSQADPVNRRTLAGADATEVHGYFGCWLDVNEDVKRFPLKPQSNGPFSNADDPQGLRSIQELMRGLHQCLVAEIHYQPDPVPQGATPGSSDNLAQRNILFDFSDNPGSFAAHLVHHTFELEPSPVSFQQSVFADAAAAGSTVRLHPDELVIDWGELPRESLVTFYMPQVDAHEVVRAAAARQAPGNLHAGGANTLRFKVTDVGFMPIPGPLTHSIAGLMSVQLPPGVPYGKTYRVVLRQVAGRSYRVLGATEFRIQVLNSQELLPRFLHNLAVLKHIALSIPADNRWHPVFQRYLSELGERIRAFGGDPDAVKPNPHGSGGPGFHGDDGDKEPGAGRMFCVTGQIGSLFYGCSGAFEGFTLIDCDDTWRFDCVNSGLERVVLTACREGMKATVHARQGRAADAALNRSCPWSGRPIRDDALTTYRGRIVGFCSPGHRDRFAAAIALFEQEIARRAATAHIAATPVVLPTSPPPPMPATRHAGHGGAPPAPGAPPTSPPATAPAPGGATLNERCPWSGRPVDREAVTDYKGQQVGFCSNAHRDEFAAAVAVFEERLACPEDCDGSRLIVERIVLHC
jgi:hypothetical protein